MPSHSLHLHHELACPLYIICHQKVVQSLKYHQIKLQMVCFHTNPHAQLPSTRLFQPEVLSYYPSLHPIVILCIIKAGLFLKAMASKKASIVQWYSEIQSKSFQNFQWHLKSHIGLVWIEEDWSETKGD